MAKNDNTKAIKALLEELHDLMTEENGWEPRTSRDYAVLTWAAIKDLQDDMQKLTNLPREVSYLKGGFALMGGSLLALAAKVIFGG